jgi:hypothetical protein
VYFISKTKIDNFAKIFKVKNTFNLSTNSFNPSVSCYFAGAFVRLTGSGMDVPIGQMLWVLYPTNRARVTIRCWKGI